MLVWDEPFKVIIVITGTVTPMVEGEAESWSGVGAWGVRVKQDPKRRGQGGEGHREFQSTVRFKQPRITYQFLML